MLFVDARATAIAGWVLDGQAIRAAGWQPIAHRGDDARRPRLRSGPALAHERT